MYQKSPTSISFLEKCLDIFTDGFGKYERKGQQRYNIDVCAIIVVL